MTAAYSLEMIVNICFYFTFINFFTIPFGSVSCLMSLPFFAVSAFLCALLSKRRVIRYFPLLLMLPSFFIFRENLASLIILAPPVAYIAYFVSSLDKFGKSAVYVSTFKAFLKGFIPLLIIFTIAGQGRYLESHSLPFALIFMFLSVVGMRVSRHDTEVVKSVKFQIINTVTVIVAAVFGLAMGSEQVLNAIIGIINAFYQHVIVPILSFIALILVWIFTPIIDFLMGLAGNGSKGQEPVTEERAYYDEFLDSAFDSGNSPFVIVIQFAATAAFIALLLYIIYRMYKMFANKQKPANSFEGIKEETSPIGGKNKPLRKRFRLGGGVRQMYTKFLIHCQKAGVVITNRDTTEDIGIRAAQSLGHKNEMDEMREIYIGIRYGNLSENKGDLKRMRELHEQIRSRK